MKYAIIEKVEKICSRRANEYQTQALVEERILSKSLMEKGTRDAVDFYGDDWVTLLYKQIYMFVDFISTNIVLGLEIPDIRKDSLVAKAAYNAALSAANGVPTKFDVSQEFYRLLMKMEVE